MAQDNPKSPITERDFEHQIKLLNSETDMAEIVASFKEDKRRAISMLDELALSPFLLISMQPHEADPQKFQLVFLNSGMAPEMLDDVVSSLQQQAEYLRGAIKKKKN